MKQHMRTNIPTPGNGLRRQTFGVHSVAREEDPLVILDVASVVNGTPGPYTCSHLTPDDARRLAQALMEGVYACDVERMEKALADMPPVDLDLIVNSLELDR
jgi:hypothetical protein